MDDEMKELSGKEVALVAAQNGEDSDDELPELIEDQSGDVAPPQMLAAYCCRPFRGHAFAVRRDKVPRGIFDPRERRSYFFRECPECRTRGSSSAIRGVRDIWMCGTEWVQLENASAGANDGGLGMRGNTASHIGGTTDYGAGRYIVFTLLSGWGAVRESCTRMLTAVLGTGEVVTITEAQMISGFSGINSWSDSPKSGTLHLPIALTLTNAGKDDFRQRGSCKSYSTAAERRGTFGSGAQIATSARPKRFRHSQIARHHAEPSGGAR
ncbi:hypothetical protein R3P38DRAFT_2767051 [Favolaschia claudopus]|uniref:Uncharacterized protein n=1 Tax=Favolaschia claudopus TaxID=2862362 RepID=A0AAW0CY58_9AGAR